MSVPTLQGYRVQEWLDAGGDKAFRTDYQLNETSIVFDVGGYRGDFAADIIKRYGCTVFVFEPIREFYEQIRERFLTDSRVNVFNYGLSDKDKQLIFELGEDATSAVPPTTATRNSVTADVRRFSSVFQELNIKELDLVKLNIEGGEYDVINDISTSGIIKKIKHLDIQFHDIDQSSVGRMTNSRKLLSEDHFPVFAFDFVWEGWSRKDTDVTPRKEHLILELARLRERVVYTSRTLDQFRHDQDAQINAIYTKINAYQKELEMNLSAMTTAYRAIKEHLELVQASHDRMLEVRIRKLAQRLLQKIIPGRAV